MKKKDITKKDKALELFFRRKKGKSKKKQTLDIKLLQKKRTSHYIKLILFSVFFASLIWLFLFNYNAKPQFNNKLVLLEITGQSTSLPGNEIKYIIKSINNESVTLNNVTLNIHYPSNFKLKTSSIYPDNSNNQWALGSLLPGQKKTLELTGILYDEPLSTSVISSTLNYTPEIFSSAFSTTTNFATNIKQPKIILQIDGPKQVSRNEEAQYKIHIKNNTTFIQKNLKISARYPEGFSTTQQEPKALKPTNGFNSITQEWLLPNIKPNESFEILILGQFESTSVTKNIYQFNIQLEYIKPDKATLTYQSKKIETQLIDKTIAISLITNGSSDNSYLSVNDEISYTLSIKNTSEEKFENIKLELRLYDLLNKQHIIDTESINIKNILIKENLGKEYLSLIWSKESFSELKSFEPEDEIEYVFTLPLNKSLITTSSNIENAQIINKAFIHTNQQSFESLSLKHTFKSDLNFESFVRYYTDNKIKVGFGPIPPVVNKETTYQINWNLSPGINTINDIKITAQLPKNIKWVGEYTINKGSLNFNKKNNQITWILNKLESLDSNISIKFLVKHTPLNSEVDTVPTLLEKTIITALDTQTKSQIKLQTKDLNTNLQGDPKLEGFGIVTKE